MSVYGRFLLFVPSALNHWNRPKVVIDENSRERPVWDQVADIPNYPVRWLE